MSGSTSTTTTAPNTALYVKNIPSKIKKSELRRQLYCLFVTYGKVLDVVATRRDGMREQAFVVFQDLASSTAALRALDGFSFYGRALAIDYAQNKSKATVVLERGPEALADPTLAFNQDGKAKKNKLTFSSAGAELRGRERKRLREEAGQRDSGSDDSDVDEADEEDDDGDGEKVDGPPDEKRRKAESNGAKSDDEGEMQMADSDDEDAASDGAELGAPLPAAGDLPNNLVFCGDLPGDATDETLEVLFQQYAGFKAVQVLPPKQGRTPPTAFALVEFASTKQAAAAVTGLNNYKLSPDTLLSVAFAKRASP